MTGLTQAAARLDRPGLAPLVDELHRRFSTGQAPVRVRLRSTTAEQRQVLADLFGSARTLREPVDIAVTTLVAALALGSVDDLRTAVQELREPIGDRRAARQAGLQAGEELWTWFAAEASRRSLVVDPVTWVEGLRRRGVRGTHVQHRRWGEDVLTVLDALPAAALTLAELAQDTLGDPHALDSGRSRAAAVLNAIGPSDGVRRDAESVRVLWESVGVAPDALSSTVLTLGLRAAPDHALAPLWSAPGAADEPAVLTLSQLRRWPLPALPAGDTAYVVENPSLVSAAARGGWRGPPLICSSGRPTVAVVTLVRQMAAAGAQVFQHADLDPVGLSITAWLAERAGTIPWRMTAQHYLAMVGTGRGDGTQRIVPATPWDPALQREMSDRQIWAYEEQARAELLEAMGQRSTS